MRATTRIWPTCRPWWARRSAAATGSRSTRPHRPFAQATGDHQWIHVDPERAAAGPFGATVAHGFLTLSLLPELFDTAFAIDDVRMGVNYGLNRVRFTGPVPVGSRVRGHFKLLAYEPLDGGAQLTVEATIELRRCGQTGLRGRDRVAPLHLTPAPPIAVRAAPARCPACDGRAGDSMKVLLVDDHPLILAALQAIIQSLGDDVTVVGADSAAGARAMLAADTDFDLVLLDLGLGDADGFEVLAEFRDAYPALPVVVVSATDAPAT